MKCPNCDSNSVKYDKQTKTYFCEKCKWERDRTLSDFN
jgi:transcription initiation factor TFIIIB Brf1 subunit/transcription initiation factor TFIIB